MAGAWRPSTVRGGGLYTSIAQDASGWRIEQVDDRQYAFKDQEDAWQTQTVDVGTWRYPAIAVANDGASHISYTIIDGLKHAIWSTSSRTTQAGVRRP